MTYSTTICGYTLLRRNGLQRKFSVVLLYTEISTDYTELSLKENSAKAESLWVKETNQHLLLGLGENVDDEFFFPNLLLEALFLQAMVLLGDFSYTDVCWKSSNVSCKQSGRLLEHDEDNFLLQMIERPTRGDAFLNLFLSNAEKLTGEVSSGGSLGCSDHTLLEFMILRDCGADKMHNHDPKSLEGKLSTS